MVGVLIVDSEFPFPLRSVPSNRFSSKSSILSITLIGKDQLCRRTNLIFRNLLFFLFILKATYNIIILYNRSILSKLIIWFPKN